MKKLITVLAIVFSTTSFAQTIPSASENDYLRLEYHGYTGYCGIGYIVGVQNYTDQEMDILITWENGSQVIHLAPHEYEVYWCWGQYVENSKIKARVLATDDGGTGIPCLKVKVMGSYYF
ncbi:MAG TPA: hypothetical protein VK483_08725 [Chitinophagaceae bacterium]|nr:hypothetical protein [Chitinophagaceae bacterium]